MWIRVKGFNAKRIYHSTWLLCCKQHVPSLHVRVIRLLVVHGWSWMTTCGQITFAKEVVLCPSAVPHARGRLRVSADWKNHVLGGPFCWTCYVSICKSNLPSKGQTNFQMSKTFNQAQPEAVYSEACSGRLWTFCCTRTCLSNMN